jgi:hypothetical protein
MALTPEDITRIVEIAVKSAMAAQRPTGGGQGSLEKGHLDERFFRRVEKFDGTAKANWREFSFQFKVAVGMANPKARNILEEIQRKGKDVNFMEIFKGDLEGEMETMTEHAEKMGHELYAMLSSLVSGEAMTVLRSITTGDGWLAWSRLSIRFDPRTPAKALISMLAVMSPKKVKEIHNMTSAVEEWEMKCKTLATDHDIVLDDRIKQAILTSMCPEEVQNMILQWTETTTTYDNLKDKVVSLSQNRAQDRKPKPMEVDYVQQESWWYSDWSAPTGLDKVDEEWAEEVELSVDYVGESCRKCGGIGHYARECPTPKGKGKGGGYDNFKGKGKGDYGKGVYYKGGYYKGGGKDYKGGGKDYSKGAVKGDGKGGFKGTCYRCDQPGHRALHCPQRAAGGGGSGGVGNSMDIGAVQQETVVGGVWAIAAVESEEWKEVKHKGKVQKEIVPTPPRTLAGSSPNANRFAGLEAEDPTEVHNDIAMNEWPKLEVGVKVKKGVKRFMKKGASDKCNEASCLQLECGVKEEYKGPRKELAICAVPFACCSPPGLEVCGVESRKWKTFSVGEITVDSAAEESVCPRAWCREFGTRESPKKLRFINASGGEMGHYGERIANFKVAGKDSAVMSLSFQISDVQKPLVAVRRITEKGNIVQFGPGDEDSFIMNKATGLRINMVRKGGSYVIPAEMLEEGFQRQVQ